jgi:rRNA maturation endonuclease Nob1
MGLTLGILLVVGVAVFVAWPLFTSKPAETSSGGSRLPGQRQKLEALKVEAYAAIKEAEFDQRMGKLSDADFAILREKYSRQAVEAIAALDEGAETRRAAEARGSRPVSRASTGKPARVRRIAYCPRCGQGVPLRANFCPSCGRSLEEEVA